MVIRSALRGKIKKQLQLKKDKMYLLDPVAVGDEVELERYFDGTGSIYSVLPRRNYLSRKAPRTKGASFRGERLEQIIASNIDRLFIVSSIDLPRFNNRMIDRIIVAAESGGIESKIIINKSDLDSEDKIEYWKKLYEEIGYQVFVTSVKMNSGFDALHKAVNNKVSCFWGQSGVGKSSILNLLFPALNLKVGKISGYSSKGKHTTVTVQRSQIDGKTFVIDTPGIREIEPYGLTEEDLGHYFTEIKERLISCKFNSCTHNHEPGCAILEAVNKGEISEERYISYLNILSSIESDIRF